MFKKILMLFLLGFFIINCEEKSEPNQNDTASTEKFSSESQKDSDSIDFKSIQYEIPLRLKESKNNKFEVTTDKKIKLKLKIPLGGREVDHNNYVLENISNDDNKINALLLILRPKTGSSKKHFTITDKDITNINLDTTRLRVQQQLATFVYFDDGDANAIKNCFISEISELDSYQKVREWFDSQYRKFKCKGNLLETAQPKENGGDVIGGS